jgi:hypothetical protein
MNDKIIMVSSYIVISLMSITYIYFWAKITFVMTILEQTLVVIMVLSLKENLISFILSVAEGIP